MNSCLLTTLLDDYTIYWTEVVINIVYVEEKMFRVLRSINSKVDWNRGEI